MENNTNPEENENQINQRDWFKASLIFAKTLGFLLQENEGVVINLTEMTKIEGQEDVSNQNAALSNLLSELNENANLNDDLLTDINSYLTEEEFDRIFSALTQIFKR
mgnify:CR=1 FL=1